MGWQFSVTPEEPLPVLEAGAGAGSRLNFRLRRRRCLRDFLPRLFPAGGRGRCCCSRWQTLQRAAWLPVVGTG